QVQEALGFEEWEVEASLSEMLLCEKDCFYSEGQESDESPGVFATLMFQLPSSVEGGVFTVSDPSVMPACAAADPTAAGAGGDLSTDDKGGRSISFSGEMSLLACRGPGMYYVAFYTHCERELSQVIDGNLLTLVYNLRRVESNPRRPAPPTADPAVSSRPTPQPPRGAAPGAAAAAAAATSPVVEETREWALEDAGFFAPGAPMDALVACGGGGGSDGESAPSGGPVDAVVARGGGGGAGGGGGGDGGAETSFAGIGNFPWAKVSAGYGSGSGGRTESVNEHVRALLARAESCAARRRSAVFFDTPEVPQPADADHVREIARAVRSWAAAGGVESPAKLVLALSHHYPSPPTSISGLKGRDRAVCHLLRLARDVLARDLGARPPVHVPAEADAGRRGAGSATGAGAMDVQGEVRVGCREEAAAAVAAASAAAASAAVTRTAAEDQGGG
ncbi:unnamed protein product, partial [Hapterophycus canaliculatus]